MSSYAILTNTGRSKEASALAGGSPLVITQIAWGDGDHSPSGGEATLLNEVGRKDVQSTGVVSEGSNAAYFDILMDAEEGPYVIREAGLFDADGDLIAIAKYDPPVNKPQDTVSVLLRIVVVFSDLENLVLQMSSVNTFVAAERQIIAGVGVVGGGDLSNDRTISADLASQSEALAGTRHDKVMTPLRVEQAIVAAVSALLDGAPDALDTLNELAAALGDNDNAMAAIITQLGLKLDATTYTAADILAKIIDANAQLRSLYINSLGHVGDGGNDYGLIIKAFEPAITLADRSDNAGSVQMRAHADGALWLLRDVLNDTTIGHSSNTTTKVFVKFTLEGPIFYDNSGAEIGRVTSAGFVGSGASLTDVIPDRLAPTATTVPNLDWDDAVETGMYRANDADNAPLSNWTTGYVYAHADAWIIQVVWGSSSSVDADTNTWRRNKQNGIWTGWTQTLSSKTEIKALAAATPFTGPAPSAGDFGFSADFDDIIVGGVYSISGSWVNGPWQAESTSYVATMQVIERQWGAGARFTQIVYEWGRMSQRTGTGDPVSWSGWKRTATVDDLIGYGQSWQDVSASRSVSTSYQNTTGKALDVAVTLQTSQTRYLQTSVDGVTFVNTASCGGHGNDGDTDTASISIPDGHYYRIDGSGTISNWAELRA